MALGSHKGSSERLMFFDIEEEFGNYFDWDYAHRIFSEKPKGQHKHSLYLSVYRTLEHTDLCMLGSLYLTTKDGKTLQIDQGEYLESYGNRDFYVYQELCPINPLVVSRRTPRELIGCMTDPATKVWVPKIVFTDMKIIDFDDPHTGNIGGRYDYNRDHLKACIEELKGIPDKSNKTLDRSHIERFTYQIIDNAVYVGDDSTMLTYPMPSEKELNSTYFSWAKSADIL